MTFYFAFLEFLGTTELLVIAVVALIVFGPRRLPEIGRTVGKTLSEFKRASEDFKRTWEREVEIDRIERDLSIDLDADLTNNKPAADGAATDETDAEERTIARGPVPIEGDAESDSAIAAVEGSGEGQDSSEPSAPPRKHDWL